MTRGKSPSDEPDTNRSRPIVDMKSHVPALSVTLGGRIGIHALRHNARQLGLDLREWRIIQLLGCNGLSTIFEIADFIGMDRGGTSRSISRLEERGIVNRKDDPSDRRRSFVELTEEGWEIHDKIAHFALAREARLLRNFSPEESVQVRNLLNRLIAEADDMVAEGWTPGSGTQTNLSHPVNLETSTQGG